MCIKKDYTIREDSLIPSLWTLLLHTYLMFQDPAGNLLLKIKSVHYLVLTLSTTRRQSFNTYQCQILFYVKSFQALVPTCPRSGCCRMVPTCSKSSCFRLVPTCSMQSCCRLVPTCSRSSRFRLVTSCSGSSRLWYLLDLGQVVLGSGAYLSQVKLLQTSAYLFKVKLLQTLATL